MRYYPVSRVFSDDNKTTGYFIYDSITKKTEFMKLKELRQKKGIQEIAGFRSGCIPNSYYANMASAGVDGDGYTIVKKLFCSGENYYEVVSLLGIVSIKSKEQLVSDLENNKKICGAKMISNKLYVAADVEVGLIHK